MNQHPNGQALVKNAASKKQVQKAERKEVRDRMKELNDLRFILSERPGRRYIWNLLSACRVYGNLFDNSGSVTAYNLGMREVGMNIIGDIMDADPQAYLMMMQENKNEIEQQEENSNGNENERD